MTATFESPDLTRFAGVLARAAADVLGEGEGIVSKGALNIKTEARRLAPHGRHTPHYASSISYDIEVGPNFVEAQVGPVLARRQGPLGGILEYGSPTSPPHPHHEPAADAEEPRFYKACEDLAARLVERYG